MPDFETLTVRIKGEASGLERTFQRVAGSARKWSSGMVRENDKASASFGKTGESIEEVTVNLTDFQRVGAATAASMPTLIAGIGGLVPATTAAAQGAASLGTAVGAGTAGLVVFGKTAITAARVGLAAYTEAVKSTVTASREAYLAQNQQVEKQLEQYRTTKLNTQASNQFNEAVNRLTMAQIDLQAAVGNRVFPAFTKWINLVLENREALQRPFLQMVSQVTNVADSFVMAASKGQLFKNVIGIMDFVRTTTVSVTQELANFARTGLLISPMIIKPTKDLIGFVQHLSQTFNTWARSGEGLRTIGNVIQYMRDQMFSVISVGMNVGRILLNIGSAMGWAKQGSEMLNGLAQLTFRLSEMTARGTEGYKMFQQLGAQSQPILQALWGLFKEVAIQAGTLVRNLMGAKDAATGLNPIIPVINAIKQSISPLRQLVQDTFIQLAPALAKLIPELAKLAQVFAGSTNAQATFITNVARLLHIFNSLPGPVKGVVAELVAWNLIIKSVGGTGITGIIASIIQWKVQLATLRAAQAAANGQTAASGTIAMAAAVKQKAAAVAMVVWTGAVKAAIVAGRILRVVTLTMLGPWGLLAAAVVLGAILIIKNWDKVKAAARFLAKIVVAAWRYIRDWVVKQAKEAASNAVANFNMLRKGVSTAIEATRKFVGNAVDWIRKNTIGRAQDTAKGTVLRFQNLRKGVSDAAEATRKWVSDKFEALKNGAIARYEDMKKGVTSRVDDMRRNVLNLVDRLRGGIASLWDKIVGGARSFGDGFKRIVVDAIQGAVNQMRKWLGAAALGLSNLLDKLGVGPVEELRDVGENLQQPLQFHEGGIAMGNKPYFAGEQGEKEAIVNLDRKTPQSRRAAKHVARMYPNAWAGKRTDGEGLGPTHHNVADVIRERANKISSATGTSWNTYVGHGKPGGSTEDYTVDFWGPGGRGSTISKSAGFKTADLAINKYNGMPPVLYVIRQGEYWRGGNWSGNTYGDPHYDHTHVSWESPRGTATASGGGPNVLALWNNFTSALGAFPSGGILDLFSGLGGNVLGWIKDWVMSKVASMVGFSGTSPKGLTLGEAVLKGGWPSSMASTAVGVAWEESGANASAQNPSGARGLFQIMPATAKGIGVSYDKLKDPIYNAQAAKKVHDQQGWGAWVAYPPSQSSMRKGTQPVTGYGMGGVIPGRKNQKVLMMAHAGERVLPERVNRAFEHMAHSIEDLDRRHSRLQRGQLNLAGRAEGDRKELHEIRDILRAQERKMHRIDEWRDAFVQGAGSLQLSDFADDIHFRRNTRAVKRVRELLGSYTNG